MLACGQVLDARVVHVGVRGAGDHVEAQHEVVSPAEDVEHQARPRAVEVSHDEESSQDDDETGLSEMPTACWPSASAGSVAWAHNPVKFLTWRRSSARRAPHRRPACREAGP